jgi:TRAP-type C4-dicarboxylate transport system substrate-binding protein
VCRQVSEAKEAEVLEGLKADGVTVIEVPDKTPWVEAVSSVDAISNAIAAEQAAYDQIISMK